MKKITQIFKDIPNMDTKQLPIYETIFKKDKEIENLKLSLFTFELEEGEKLMSAIFISTKKDIIY